MLPDILSMHSLIPGNQKLNDIVLDFLFRLKNKKEVLGLCIFGSLAKYQSIDSYSDIDIGVFLQPHEKANYLPAFSFYIDICAKRWEMNLSQFYVKKELERQWSITQKQAFRDCVIIYQEKQVIENLINLKANLHTDKKEILVTNINQIEWRLIKHSVIAFNRNAPESSHLLINEAIQLLLECIFILNDTFMPHTKWTFIDLYTLKHLPRRHIDDLKECLLITSYTWGDITRRIEATMPIYTWVKEEAIVIDEGFPKDVYKYWAAHYSNRQIHKSPFVDLLFVEYGEIFTKDEWQLLEGFISYNLISTEDELIGFLESSSNHGSNYRLSSDLTHKLRTVIERNGSSKMRLS